MKGITGTIILATFPGSLGLMMTSSNDCCAAATKFESRIQFPTCSNSLITAQPRDSAYHPWTYAPFCIQSPTTLNKVCVFTDENYQAGQGISIIARPDVADMFTSDGLLESPSTPMVITNNKYVAKSHAAKGIGLFVTPFSRINAGETILVDYPAIVVPHEVLDPLSTTATHELQWRALLQLPDYTKVQTRGLAKSGSNLDEVENIIRTNAFTQKKGEFLHDHVYIKAAVSREF
jgi:hypothetical protein